MDDSATTEEDAAVVVDVLANDSDPDGDGLANCVDPCPNDPDNDCVPCPDGDSDGVCDADDIDAETQRYESLLKNHPVDVACIGIGENGHIAFNDPPVADFEDPHLVKVVDLDEACRQHDGRASRGFWC